jgi:hypothetical protein
MKKNRAVLCKGRAPMDSTIVQYVGFIVAALILIWAVIEINRRFERRRKIDPRSPHTWIRMDANQPDTSEEALPAPGDETPAATEPDLQTRARQNGHYSESKRV